MEDYYCYAANSLQFLSESQKGTDVIESFNAVRIPTELFYSSWFIASTRQITRYHTILQCLSWYYIDKDTVLLPINESFNAVRIPTELFYNIWFIVSYKRDNEIPHTSVLELTLYLQRYWIVADGWHQRSYILSLLHECTYRYITDAYIHHYSDKFR